MDGFPVARRPLRLALFGDGRWAADALRLLATGPHRVVGVVIRARPSDDRLERAAAELGIPVLQPKPVNAPGAVDRIRALAADLNLSIAYDQIIRPPLLSLAPLGFVNFHAGKLPDYRGRNVVNWAIINGEREIGVTAHYMDEGIDTGDVILQRVLPIAWTDGYGDVLDRVVAEIPPLVAATVQAIADGTAGRCPQPIGAGTYFGGRGEGDEWLDWSETSERLHNKIRGITRPGPGARTLIGSMPVTVWRASYERDWPRYRATPGQIVALRDGDGVLVKTGDSTLLVQEVEVAGHGPRIAKWPIGTRLGVDVVALAHRLAQRPEHA